MGSACVFALNNNSTSITFLHCQTFERQKKERNKMADGKCFKLPFSPTLSTNELWEREKHMSWKEPSFLKGMDNFWGVFLT